MRSDRAGDGITQGGGAMTGSTEGPEGRRVGCAAQMAPAMAWDAWRFRSLRLLSRMRDWPQGVNPDWWR